MSSNVFRRPAPAQSGEFFDGAAIAIAIPIARCRGRSTKGDLPIITDIKINAAGVRAGGSAGVIKITVDDIFDPLGASQPDLHIAVKLLDKSVGGSIHLHTVDIHNTPHTITDGHLAVKIQGRRIGLRFSTVSVTDSTRYVPLRVTALVAGKVLTAMEKGMPFSLTI